MYSSSYYIVLTYPGFPINIHTTINVGLNTAQVTITSSIKQSINGKLWWYKCTIQQGTIIFIIQYSSTQTWYLFLITWEYSQILLSPWSKIVCYLRVTLVVSRIWLTSGGNWLLHKSSYEPPYEFHRGNTSTTLNSWNTWSLPHTELLSRYMDININKQL